MVKNTSAGKKMKKKRFPRKSRNQRLLFGRKMLSCERIQPKTIFLTVREGFMSERRSSASTRKKKSRKSVLFVSNEYGSDLRSNEHYISSSENRTIKNSGLYGI